MSELTEKQKKKLLSAAEIVDKGDMAVLTKLLEFEDTLENNGITLCHAHHPRGRGKEAELSPYLQSLVAERK